MFKREDIQRRNSILQLKQLKRSKSSASNSLEFKLDFKESETLQGIHSYDILKNPMYTESFQYVPVQVPDGFQREDFIIDDDDDDENNCA